MLGSANTEALNNDIMSEIVESEERKAEAALDTDRSDERELRDNIEAIVNKSPIKPN